MLVVVGYIMVWVNILRAVWNLATIVGKTILSRVNTIRPGRADLNISMHFICGVNFQATCGCGVGLKARTASEKAVAIHSDNILKSQICDLALGNTHKKGFLLSIIQKIFFPYAY